MNTTDMVLISAIIVLIASNFMLKWLNKSKQKLIDQLQAFISENTKTNDEVLNYCLRHIFNEAIRKEDYEQAQKCKELLETLKTVSK
jgi:hypothetical protein